LRVEVQTESGQPVSGFALADCAVITGDSIERTVAWNSRADLRKLAGQVVRLKFELRDADLFALRFAA